MVSFIAEAHRVLHQMETLCGACENVLLHALVIVLTGLISMKPETLAGLRGPAW